MLDSKKSSVFFIFVNKRFTSKVRLERNLFTFVAESYAIYKIKFILFRSNLKGVVLEWLKRHAWKACKRQKRFGGSNPPHSANLSF